MRRFSTDPGLPAPLRTPSLVVARLVVARLAILLMLVCGCASPAVQGQTAPGTRTRWDPVHELGQALEAGPSPSSTKVQLTGTVADGVGALIPAARLGLEDGTGAETGTTTTDGAGQFRFPAMPPGTYTVVIAAPGFRTLRSPRMTLRPDTVPLPLTFTLELEESRADVTVSLTRHELASDEIHAAEQQRVLRLFPNFYTSFVPAPQPLSSGQKFSLAFHATADPMAFVTAGLAASGEQIHNTFPAYGSGAEGYSKRYGAAYADAFSGKFLGAALLPALFRQDPRYFYLGAGPWKVRARHAVLSAFLARHDTGRWEPNYAHILGNASAGALSTVYHPAVDSAGKLAWQNALLGTVGEAAVNLTREFLLRPFTRGAP